MSLAAAIWASIAFPAASPPVELVLQVGHGEKVTGVAFSPDGAQLATAAAGEVKLWDVRSAELLRTFTPVEMLPDDSPRVAFSPDGSRLAATVADRVLVWELAAGRRVLTLGMPNSVLSLAWSHDGRRLASTSLEGGLKLWDASSGREVRGIRRSKRDWVGPVAFSPDGQILAVGETGRVRLWSPNLQPLGTLEGHGPEVVLGLAFLGDGRLASSSEDGTLRLWEPRSRRELRRWDAPVGRRFKERYDALAVTTDGRRLAVIARGGVDYIEKRVVIYETTGDEAPLVVSREASAEQLAYSPDGRWLAFGEVNRVRLLSVTDGEPSRQLAGRPARPWQSTFSARPVVSPDGRFVATLDTDGATRLWDAASMALSHVLQGDPKHWVESAVFSPDSTRLAAFSGRSEVNVWDTRSGKRVLTLDTDRETVRDVAYSPDGSRIATGGFPGGIRLWDPVTGRLTREIATAGIDMVQFLDGGRSVAAGELHKPTPVFDVETGRRVRVLPHGLHRIPEIIATSQRFERLVPPERVLRGTTFRPYLTLSPDERLAVAVDFGRPTRGVDTKSGIWLWRQPEDEPHMVPVWSRDGRLLFSVDVDGQLRVHEAATGQLLVTALVLPAAAGETALEWITYTPDGYFDGSPGAEAFVRWREQGKLLPSSARAERRRPEVIRQRLSLRPPAAEGLLGWNRSAVVPKRRWDGHRRRAIRHPGKGPAPAASWPIEGWATLPAGRGLDENARVSAGEAQARREPDARLGQRRREARWDSTSFCVRRCGRSGPTRCAAA